MRGGLAGRRIAYACCIAHAQAPFPNRPIRLIVTSPAGGANDILNRTLAAKLSDSIGQPLLIDNRPGASGFVAAEMVAKSSADGYTLLGATEATLVANPLFFRKVPYDPQRDFSPVTMTVEVNYVLLVHPSVAASSVPELIALARSKPGALNYASSGNGRARRNAGERDRQAQRRVSARAAFARGARAAREFRLRGRRERARGVRLPHAQRIAEIGARDTGVRRKARMKAGNHVAPARHGLQLRFSLRAQGS